MADHAAPTADDFRLKFPEFEDLPDVQIDALIAEASRSVDETWTEGDFANAVLYLAAHFNQAATDALDTPGGQSIVAEHFGPISVSYGRAQVSGKDNPSIYDSTEYGRRFLSLLKKNIPAVLVI